MVAFKGSKEEIFGLYLAKALSDPLLQPFAEKGDDGSLIDPDATGMPITALGIERDGFRNGWLAIPPRHRNDEESMAGVYVTRVPSLGTLAARNRCRRTCLASAQIVRLTRMQRRRFGVVVSGQGFRGGVRDNSRVPAAALA